MTPEELTVSEHIVLPTSGRGRSSAFSTGDGYMPGLGPPKSFATIYGSDAERRVNLEAPKHETDHGRSREVAMTMGTSKNLIEALRFGQGL